MKAALDNDILHKGICYGILPELLGNYGGASKEIGILGAARFVLRGNIEKRRLNRGTAAALLELAKWIPKLIEMEPTSEEQSLAAEFELIAQRMSANLDVGESQLCAMVVVREIPVLLTGDKRAIAAVEQLLDGHERLGKIRKKLRCLEQLVLDIIAPSNLEAIRTAVCMEPEVDKTLAICFACASPAVEPSEIAEGLNSYIKSLREVARRVLAD